jgi:hypothetical protein
LISGIEHWSLSESEHEVHRGEHEPILTRDLFEAVQAKRADLAAWT